MKIYLTSRIINRIIAMGIMVFVLLYLYSAGLYPGGSQADLEATGFDWINNYWCNLLNETGMNGQPNPARPFAIAAMGILCLSLLLFFLQYAALCISNQSLRKMVSYSAFMSMLTAAFIFSSFHDLLTIASSFFGLLVLIGLMQEIARSGRAVEKAFGLLCLLLLGINNVIYYSGFLIEWLPLIQKLTFAVVLLFVLWLNTSMSRKLLLETEPA